MGLSSSDKVVAALLEGSPVEVCAAPGYEQGRARGHGGHGGPRTHFDFVEAVPEAMVVCDPRGRAQTANRKAAELLGFASVAQLLESIRRPIELVAPEDHERVRSVVRELPRRGTVDRLECHLLRRDGGAFLVEMSVACVYCEGGELLGFAGTLRDITERKRLEDERLGLLAAAEKANRTKDLFMATLSHELRTPLTAAILAAEELLADSSPATVRRCAETITRSVQTQVRIIDDLFDTARIIEGKFHLCLEDADLATLAHAALESARPAAEAKGVALVSDIVSPNELGLAHCDPSRTLQVMLNLVANAVKFTPKGGRVTLALRRKGANAEIKVGDTGRGIAPQLLPKVFERFTQAETPDGRRLRGLGMGLAIVRDIVEIHGGSVSAASPGLGQGATFTVTLPLGRSTSDLGAVSLEGDALDKKALRGIRVLLVDDDEAARDALTEAVRACGADVYSVSSTAEALNELACFRPDVLLSDIFEPEEDGCQLITRVRALTPEQGGDVPAVALTALATKEHQAQALRIGYDRCIVKPISRRALSATLRAIVADAAAPWGGE